jgi:hypothetical protein
MMPVDLWLLDLPPVPPIADPKACPQAAMKWHFSFGDFGDLTRLPNLVDELREVPVREVVPKGYGPHAPTAGVLESGGSTRARKRFIVMPERDEQVTRWRAAKLLETPGSGTSRAARPFHEPPTQLSVWARR